MPAATCRIAGCHWTVALLLLVPRVRAFALIADGNIATAATAWADTPTSATTTYGDIAGWNTAAVKTMDLIFASKLTFNANIVKWNTASVTTMRSMFQGASSFNQNVVGWNVRSVSNPSGFYLVFDGTTALSNCTKASLYRSWGPQISTLDWATLYGCAVGPRCVTCITNGNIRPAVEAWVTNPSGALSTYGDISLWDTGAVTDMFSLFAGTKTFNEAIGDWNTASVTGMQQTFYNAAAFNADISKWNVRSDTRLPSAHGHPAACKRLP
jgi:hypothetical protein